MLWQLYKLLWRKVSSQPGNAAGVPVSVTCSIYNYIEKGVRSILLLFWLNSLSATTLYGSKRHWLSRYHLPPFSSLRSERVLENRSLKNYFSALSNQQPVTFSISSHFHSLSLILFILPLSASSSPFPMLALWRWQKSNTIHDAHVYCITQCRRVLRKLLWLSV